MRVTITLIPRPLSRHGEEYRVTFTKQGRPRVTGYVSPPGVLTRALDCPEAFDDVALAGAAFLLHEHGSTWSESDFDWCEDGPCFHRKAVG